jgi:hypothetical protein
MGYLSSLSQIEYRIGILNIVGFSGGDYVLLDPFTMQKEVVRGKVPYPGNASYDDVLPNSTLTSWIVSGENDTAWFLYSRDDSKVLWHADRDYFGQPPQWSPDGRYFVTDAQLHGGHLLERIDQDGNSLPLVNSMGENASLSWSPDERFIAIAIARIATESDNRTSYSTTTWDTIIIDLQKHQGYLLAQDAVPIAWMVNP